MKYGKLYTYENAKDARHLIGKKVLCSCVYGHIILGKGDQMTLDKINDENLYPFIAGIGGAYQFIREVEEDLTFMTNRQLAEWCIKTKGQYKLIADSFSLIYSTHNYDEDFEDLPVPDTYRIRSWGSDKWVEPTVDVYELECKEE